MTRDKNALEVKTGKELFALNLDMDIIICANFSTFLEKFIKSLTDTSKLLSGRSVSGAKQLPSVLSVMRRSWRPCQRHRSASVSVSLSDQLTEIYDAKLPSDNIHPTPGLNRSVDTVHCSTVGTVSSRGMSDAMPLMPAKRRQYRPTLRFSG